MDADGLNDIPLFSRLSRRDRRLVARHADEVAVEAGTRLIEQGRLAYEFFAIVEGTADVLDGDVKVNSVGPGDVVGEIGVLETAQRTATVVATSPMRLIVIYGPELQALAEDLPEVHDELERIIEARRRPG